VIGKSTFVRAGWVTPYGRHSDRPKLAAAVNAARKAKAASGPTMAPPVGHLRGDPIVYVAP